LGGVFVLAKERGGDSNRSKMQQSDGLLLAAGWTVATQLFSQSENANRIPRPLPVKHPVFFGISGVSLSASFYIEKVANLGTLKKFSL
jgi:hypothetical protein